MKFGGHSRRMKLMKSSFLFAAALSVTAGCSNATESPDAFAEACAAAADSAETSSVKGDAEGWLFVRNELAQLGKGKFWESFDERDPVKIIGAYQKALGDLGVELVVVPVPAKAALYPEKFAAAATLDSVTQMTPLIEQIAATGAKVVDLETLYRGELANGQLYCAQDAHWTPLGAKLAAEAVAKSLAGIVPEGNESFSAGEKEEIEISGDQAKGEYENLPKEKVMTYPVIGEGDPAKAEVLVVGDSHLQVFTDGGAQFHTTGSGFLDHLQLALKQSVASIYNSGDGVDGPRVRIVRTLGKDPAYWEGKKAVVWVFASRAFTAPIQKWREVPAKQ